MAIDFPDSPTVDQQYSVGDRTWTWNGTYWQLSQTSSTFTASDTGPVNPSAGDIWFESDTGKTFVYYDQAWVEIGAATDLSDMLSDADADTYIQVEASSDEDVIRLSTAGTERLHITAAGHVIPQANVAYDLGSATNRFRDLYLSGSSIDLGGVTISSDGTSIAMPPVSNISGDFTVDTSTLHVDSANNRVGIGTTSPDQKVQIFQDGGNLSSGNVSGETKGTIHLQNSGGTKGDGELSTGISFSGTDTGRRRALIAAFQDGIDGDPHGLQFFTYGSTTTSSDAVTSRMTISSSGNVGIGVDSPAGKLTINHDNADGVVDFTDGLMFTNNVGGGATEWSHAGIVSTGSTGFNGNLVFGTDGDSSQNTSGITERMRIDSSGNVGIGTASPAYNLDVNGTGAFRDNVSLFDTTNSAGSIGTTGGAGSSNKVQITGNRGVGGVDIQTNQGLAARFNYNRMVYLPYVYTNTTASAVNMHVATDGNLFRSTSSQKYKTDIEDIGDEYADLVLQMRPVWYRSLCENDPSAWSYYGLIAEEVAELDPRLVHYGHKDGCECPEDESGMKQHEASCFVEPEGVQYDRIVPHLINIVQRQQSTIETLTARIEALEAN